jgi:hypothetical protein
MARTAMIKLVCLNCNRTIDYGRDIDPSIPANVARIEQPHCNECWDGEREGETWIDGAGNEVSQV